MLRTIFLFFLIVYFQYALGQHILIIQASDYDSNSLGTLLPVTQPSRDSISSLNLCNKIINQLFAKGYVNAHVQDIYKQRDTLFIQLSCGKPVRWGRIEVDEELTTVKELSRYKNMNGRFVTFNELDKWITQVLKYYENNGYPFASVQLKQLSQKGTEWFAELDIEPGRLIIIDSIAIQGDINILNRYVQNYLGIKKGSLYNEEAIRGISQKIQELPFIEITRSPSVNFYAGKAIITLYLKKRNANRFDFIIGVLPNSSLLSNTGRVIITGDVQLNLHNALGNGEQLSLRFEKFQARTTRARSRVIYPFLLSTPFGIDAGFNLFVNDSIFRNLEYDLGIQYQYSGGNYIKGYYKRFESRIISVDTSLILFTKKLPSTLDINNSIYGIEYAFDKTDFRFNPRKGYGYLLNVGVGLRRIIPNTKIVSLKDASNPEYSFRSLYDSLPVDANQYRITLKVYKYWPLSRHTTLKTQMETGYLLGNTPVVGELYRLGGNKLLRGFDEESIWVSEYQMLTFEYRILLDQYSFVSVFSDGALVRRFANDRFIQSNLLGLGAGFTFQTRAGIFNISYALGRSDTSPISFRAAKIHFGYINLF